MQFKLLAAFILIVSSFNSVSQEKLRVAFGNALSPWVIPASNSGIILDIIRTALEPVGYEIEPIYFPYARRINSYRNDLVDVSSDMNQATIAAEELIGFYSGNIYQYQNYLISLKENNFKFESLSDIGKHSLISWQGALAHLGDDYAKIMNTNPNYSETHDQALQVRMLFLKRYDIAQMDIQIFNYYRNYIQNLGIIDTRPKVDLFPILGHSPNGFLFKEKKVRDAFVTRIKALKSSGEFQKIFDKYSLQD